MNIICCVRLKRNSMNTKQIICFCLVSLPALLSLSSIISILLLSCCFSTYPPPTLVREGIFFSCKLCAFFFNQISEKSKRLTRIKWKKHRVRGRENNRETHKRQNGKKKAKQVNPFPPINKIQICIGQLWCLQYIRQNRRETKSVLFRGKHSTRIESDECATGNIEM